MTGYPLLCFHVFRGREKNKTGPAHEKWTGGHEQAREEPVNFAEGHSRACFPRHNAEVVERQAKSFFTSGPCPSLQWFQPATSPGSATSIQGPSSAALVVPPGQFCFKAEDPSLAFCSQSCYCCHLRESSCRQDKERGNPLKALVDVAEGSEDSPSWASGLFSFTVSRGLCVFPSCAAPRFPLDRALVYP